MSTGPSGQGDQGDHDDESDQGGKFLIKKKKKKSAYRGKEKGHGKRGKKKKPSGPDNHLKFMFDYISLTNFSK